MYIKSDDNIFLSVYKYIIIRFDKDEIEFFYILWKVLILNIRKLFKLIKNLI